MSNTKIATPVIKPMALIAYHANCIDGFMAATIAADFMGLRDFGYTLVPMHYTPESESALLLEAGVIDYAEIYILDFSVSVDTLKELGSLGNTKVTLLDHHKTAFEKYFPNFIFTSTSYANTSLHGVAIVLDNMLSGAGIAWRYFHPDVPAPALVRYVQDYDLWLYDFRDDTRYMNKYLQALPLDVRVWMREVSNAESSIACLKDMLAVGKKLQAEHDKKVADVVAKKFTISIEEGLIFTVECDDKSLVSDVGHRLAEINQKFGCIAIGSSYSYTPEAATYTWSLRSIGDVDVSTIAKMHGGGGHKNAAGFTVSKEIHESLILGAGDEGEQTS